MLDDGETQAGSAFFSGPALVDTVKTLEDSGEVLWGNPDTVIGDRDLHSSIDRLYSDRKSVV